MALSRSGACNVEEAHCTAWWLGASGGFYGVWRATGFVGATMPRCTNACLTDVVSHAVKLALLMKYAAGRYKVCP
jgi:hypothetical protein